MSTTITIYEGCRLNNNYNEVFNNKSDLNTYLNTLTKKVIYTSTEDDLYFTNNGSISIDNETNNTLGLLRHGDRYNYMKIERTLDGSRYAFIDSITIVDGVCVLNYTEDIWTNYGLMMNAISFKVKNSILAQADYLSPSDEYASTDIASLPKQLPVPYEALANPSFYFSPTELQYDDGKEVLCYVLITASVYKSAQQGEYSARFINNYLLAYTESATGGVTPANTYKTYTWRINNDTLNVINDLVTLASVTSITYQTQPSFKYEILDVKLIPKTIGDDWFYQITESGTGLYPDFKISGQQYDVDTTQQTAVFDTDYTFNNICHQFSMRYVDAGGNVKYTYNGFEPTDDIICSKTIRFSDSDKITGLGNYSRFIPLVWNGLDIDYNVQLNVNANGNSITLCVDNQLYDVSNDFRYSVPFEIQTATAMQQARISRAIGTFQNIMGIMNTGVSAGAGMINNKTGLTDTVRSGNWSVEGMYAGVVSNTFSATNSMISRYEANQQINQRSFTSNKAIHTEDITCRNLEIGGFREYQCNPENELFVQSIINKYGYLYQLLVNDYKIFYTMNTHYVRFSVVNVYGEFSQSVAHKLEEILVKGIILLNQYTI